MYTAKSKKVALVIRAYEYAAYICKHPSTNSFQEVNLQ